MGLSWASIGPEKWQIEPPHHTLEASAKRPRIARTLGGRHRRSDFDAYRDGGRRPRGTGSLYLRHDASGREHWYARFYSGGDQLKRAIGLRRLPGTRIGLTRTEAERVLRRLIDETHAVPQHGRVEFAAAAAAVLTHLERIGRKATTLSDYRSAVRVHLRPAFGRKPLASIGVQEIQAFMRAKAREGKAPKRFGTGSGYSTRSSSSGSGRGWVRANP